MEMLGWVSVVLYRLAAPYLIRAFIQDPETVRLGTQFLQARCFATPVMFLSFHMVHFMQAVNRGKVSLHLALIRQLCLQIPILLVLLWLQLINFHKFFLKRMDFLPDTLYNICILFDTTGETNI